MFYGRTTPFLFPNPHGPFSNPYVAENDPYHEFLRPGRRRTRRVRKIDNRLRVATFQFCQQLLLNFTGRVFLLNGNMQNW